jgi:hypothetical protein
MIKGISTSIDESNHSASLFKLHSNPYHPPSTMSARFSQTQSEMITYIPSIDQKPVDRSSAVVQEPLSDTGSRAKIQDHDRVACTAQADVRNPSWSPSHRSEGAISAICALDAQSRSADGAGPSKQFVNTDGGSKQALTSCLKRRDTEFPSFPDRDREPVRTLT